MPSVDPPVAVPRVNMDPNFEKRLRELKDASALESSNRRLGLPVPWYRPAGWSGDLHDVEGMATPFDRQRANDEAVQAIADPDAPGVCGDVTIAVVMAETLACMERSFRVRHTTGRCRAAAHALGRKRGHGGNNGAFLGNGVEYVRDMLNQARAPL